MLVSVVPEGTPEVHPNEFLVAAPSANVGRSQRKHKWIVRLYVLSFPLATVAWLTGIGWVATKFVGYVLS